MIWWNAAGSKTWQRHSGKWTENMGGYPANTPLPPRTTLGISGEINQLEGTGWLPQNSNGGPLWGLGVFHLQIRFEFQQSIETGQWRHRGGTQCLLISCGWLSCAKGYAHSWTLPRKLQPCLPLRVKALQQGMWHDFNVLQHWGNL